MLWNISSVPSPLAATQSTIPVQKDPAPTSAGMASEASKPNASALFRIGTSSLFGYDVYQSSGTVELGLMNPPRSIQPWAPSGVARNSSSARFSSSACV